MANDHAITLLCAYSCEHWSVYEYSAARPALAKKHTQRHLLSSRGKHDLTVWNQTKNGPLREYGPFHDRCVFGFVLFFDNFCFYRCARFMNKLFIHQPPLS